MASRGGTRATGPASSMMETDEAVQYGPQTILDRTAAEGLYMMVVNDPLFNFLLNKVITSVCPNKIGVTLETAGDVFVPAEWYLNDVVNGAWRSELPAIVRSLLIFGFCLVTYSERDDVCGEVVPHAISVLDVDIGWTIEASGERTYWVRPYGLFSDAIRARCERLGAPDTSQNWTRVLSKIPPIPIVAEIASSGMLSILGQHTGVGQPAGSMDADPASRYIPKFQSQIQQFAAKHHHTTAQAIRIRAEVAPPRTSASASGPRPSNPAALGSDHPLSVPSRGLATAVAPSGAKSRRGGAIGADANAADTSGSKTVLRAEPNGKQDKSDHDRSTVDDDDARDSAAAAAPRSQMPLGQSVIQKHSADADADADADGSSADAPADQTAMTTDDADMAGETESGRCAARTARPGVLKRSADLTSKQAKKPPKKLLGRTDAAAPRVPASGAAGRGVARGTNLVSREKIADEFTRDDTRQIPIIRGGTRLDGDDDDAAAAAAATGREPEKDKATGGLSHADIDDAASRAWIMGWEGGVYDIIIESEPDATRQVTSRMRSVLQRLIDLNFMMTYYKIRLSDILNSPMVFEKTQRTADSERPPQYGQSWGVTSAAGPAAVMSSSMQLPRGAAQPQFQALAQSFVSSVGVPNLNTPFGGGGGGRVPPYARHPFDVDTSDQRLFDYSVGSSVRRQMVTCMQVVDESTGRVASYLSNPQLERFALRLPENMSLSAVAPQEPATGIEELLRLNISMICSAVGIPPDIIIGAKNARIATEKLNMEQLETTISAFRNFISDVFRRAYWRISGAEHAAIEWNTATSTLFPKPPRRFSVANLSDIAAMVSANVGAISVEFRFSRRLSYDDAMRLYLDGWITRDAVAAVAAKEFGLSLFDMTSTNPPSSIDDPINEGIGVPYGSAAASGSAPGSAPKRGAGSSSAVVSGIGTGAGGGGGGSGMNTFVSTPAAMGRISVPGYRPPPQAPRRDDAPTGSGGSAPQDASHAIRR